MRRKECLESVFYSRYNTVVQMLRSYDCFFNSSEYSASSSHACSQCISNKCDSAWHHAKVDDNVVHD